MLLSQTRRIAVGAAILLIASSAMQAAIVNYRVKINGNLAGSGPGGAFVEADIGVDMPFTVDIEVNVPDAPLDAGGYGGVNGYGLSITDAAEIVLFDDAGDGTWDRTTPMSIGSFTAGALNQNGFDVYMDTANDLNNFSYGAGPGAWSLVCSGEAMWNGGDGELVIEQAVNSQGTAVPHMVLTNTGVEPATAVNPTVVYFGVPEPATSLLILCGGLGLVRRRRA